MEKIRPIVVISKCLEFEKCRYNGSVIPQEFVRRLAGFVQFIPVCPEVEIGLGIPREPVRIVGQPGKERLIQPATGADLTALMEQFGRAFIAGLGEVDGFILKAGSPSCGLKDVKSYPVAGPSAALGHRGAGFFARRVMERFPELAVEDELRLTNSRIREHFLIKLFLLSRWRKIRKTRRAGDVVRFHSDNKLLLMAYHQQEMRNLGRIVANGERRPLAEVLADYQAHLYGALSHMARTTNHINTAMHVLGYFSDKISRKEKSFFLSSLEQYRQGLIPLIAVLNILRTWNLRFEQPYLQGQTYFEPYPEGLRDGKGSEH